MRTYEYLGLDTRSKMNLEDMVESHRGFCFSSWQPSLFLA